MNARTLGMMLCGAMLLLGCDDDDGGGDGSADGSSGGGTTSATTENPTTASATATTGTPSTSTTGSTGTPGSTTGSGETTAASSESTAGGDDSSSSTGSIQACEGMSFFATSVGSGENGGNLGGLEGADATCQALAEAAGQGACTWRAYLSTSTVDARDRIGSGPWQNFDGDAIAETVEALHGDGLSNGDPQYVLDEYGSAVPGNEHDILTGSMEDGTVLADSTCADWTSSSSDDVGQVGHSDIPGNPNFSPSWNAAHLSSGCSAGDLQGTGGSGRLYCFAL